MDAADWQRVKAIFQEALDRPAEEQDAYVNGACGGNGAVRRAVETLLSNDRQNAAFLEEPAAHGRDELPIATGPPETQPVEHARLEIGEAFGSPQPIELAPLLRRRLLSLTLIELTIYAERHAAEMSILARQSAILWLAHIVAYGTFIPNTGRRCGVVTGLMAASAVAVVGIGGWLNHVPIAPLSLYLGEMVGWMVISIAMAVYGSQKITRYREEALAARKLGQYQLKQRLGQGGMGEVYLAEHVLLKRPCAVKVIRPEQVRDPTATDRFLREVHAAATLTHPNSIQVFDYGRAGDGTLFYAMEYLAGSNLQDLVETHGPMPPGRVVFVLRQLCGAPTEAHAIGLVHRDIKPSNVILCNRAGLHDIAKLLDFGLVRMTSADVREARLTAVGVVFGTPAYMSPEQAAGATSVDRRSDIYSLGALACFLLTGEPPFARANVMQTLAAHLHDHVEHIPRDAGGVPDDLEKVILRCLQKHPGDRFSETSDLEAALAGCRSSGEWTQLQAAAWAAAVAARGQDPDDGTGAFAARDPVAAERRT